MTVLRDALQRGAKRPSSLQILFLWICVMIPVSALLYSTSASVRAKENELATIKADIAAEKDSLRVLRAEWAYLNQSQRLSARAQKYLVAKTAAAPKQILAQRHVSAKLAYRSSGNAVVADNVQIQPAPKSSTHVLAKPIAYDERVLAALHTKDDVKLPTTLSWSQKIVSAFGLNDAPAKGQ